MSAALLLRYSFNEDKAAQAIEDAITQVLAEGHRTADLAGDGNAITTAEMGDRIAQYIREGA